MKCLEKDGFVYSHLSPLAEGRELKFSVAQLIVDSVNVAPRGGA